MSLYTSSSAVCPFYKEELEDRRVIVCEGVTKNSLLQLAFQTRQSADKYKKNHCYCDGYKTCRICKMLYGKYEYEV